MALEKFSSICGKTIFIWKTEISVCWKGPSLAFRAVFKWLSKQPKPKQLLWPITAGADSAMNQSQFLAITCNSLKARERSRVHGAISFGFASHWMKNWRESFKPITKRSNRSHVITFDSHLKTAPSTRLLPNFSFTSPTTRHHSSVRN